MRRPVERALAKDRRGPIRRSVFMPYYGSNWYYHSPFTRAICRTVIKARGLSDIVIPPVPPIWSVLVIISPVIVVVDPELPLIYNCWFRLQAELVSPIWLLEFVV